MPMSRRPMFRSSVLTTLLLGAVNGCAPEALDMGEAIETIGEQHSGLAEFGGYRYTLTLDDGNTVTVDVLDGAITQTRANWLVTTADRSTVTTDPRTARGGMMATGDRIVISRKLLIWFDFTGPTSGPTNGGSGFIRGIWPLQVDSSGNFNFTNIRNSYNWAPNAMLPGANGANIQGSGTQLLLGLGNVNADDGNVNGMAAELSGVTNFVGAGSYDSGNGFFLYQAKADFRHGETNLTTLNNAGYASVWDANPSPSIDSRLEWMVTYGIPRDSYTLTLTYDLYARVNGSGPFSSIGLSNNFYGHNGGHHRWFKASTGMLDADAVCGSDGTVTVGANTMKDFVAATGTQSIRWWSSTNSYSPATLRFYEFDYNLNDGSRFKLTPIIGAGWTPPDHTTVIRQNYSAGGIYVHDYGVAIKNVNACSGGTSLSAGATMKFGYRMSFHSDTNL